LLLLSGVMEDPLVRAAGKFVTEFLKYFDEVLPSKADFRLRLCFSTCVPHHLVYSNVNVGVLWHL
jgi:hypothetical protein